MLRDIVLNNKTGVFLLSDNQILQEQFLEDINNLLNIGEIPNLFPPEDKEQLLDGTYIIIYLSSSFLIFFNRFERDDVEKEDEFEFFAALVVFYKLM